MNLTETGLSLATCLQGLGLTRMFDSQDIESMLTVCNNSGPTGGHGDPLECDSDFETFIRQLTDAYQVRVHVRNIQSILENNLLQSFTLSNGQQGISASECFEGSRVSQSDFSRCRQRLEAVEESFVIQYMVRGTAVNDNLLHARVSLNTLVTLLSHEHLTERP